ncbi:hypothetical protein [Acetobacter oeni]|uniref:Uncharacterized protein n=1 Tax=Acetobacter oeni TaxID=304077 RepID=A0A511XNZ4_9PROT|nr:hypothetical protein [Acetobacter oeni]MBB3884501.1 hypothetical protein [Acetobacter oeni]NHO20433.1 hypothetical protein [Acetobacter oeni]GBR00570.1 hypothetical protein AA21952_0147 [Acetobacter oeni LMG 21952]GEN64688.1 hypothetical protein AOE01nite_29120 [Acetobacter oeni]
MADSARYIVYRTAASEDQAAGYIVNAVMWDGITNYSPGSGLALAADPAGQYPIGGSYVAPTS